MRVEELIEGRDGEIEEWKASRALCKGSKPNSSIGASALASCKSQGFRRREGNKSHKLGQSKNSRVTVGGKKLKGKKYGGRLPDYGSGSKSKSKKKKK